MKKRIVAIIVLIVSLFSVFPVMAAQQNDSERYEEAYNVLKALSVLDERIEYTAEHIITRAELAQTIMLLMNRSIGEDKTTFQDVSIEEDYSGAISYLNAVGVIASASNYHPDDEALYEQAVKMIVCLMGYQGYAESIGAYPDGYLKVAKQIGLTNHIHVSNGEPLNGELLAVLIYNSLMSETAGVDYKGEIYLNGGETAFKKYFDGEKLTGIITANKYTSLTTSLGAGGNYIKVGNYEIADEELIAQGYLGMLTECWCIEDDGDYSLVYAKPVKKNEIIEVDASDILPSDSRFTTTYFVYTEDDKKEYIKIDANADVIYNFRAEPNFTEDTLKPAQGRVVFVDNNNDSLADVVLVYESRNIFVKSVSKNVIYGNHGEMLDVEDCSDVTVGNMFGEKADIDKITAYNVLSVVESTDGEIVDITIYDDPVFGEVENVYQEDNKTYVTIDGDTFAIANSYIAAVNTGDAIDIKYGMYGTFYLDAAEEIAGYVDKNDASSYLQTGNSVWQYAYLIRGYENSFEEIVSLKYLVDKNGTQRASCTPKVMIDGKRCKYAEIVEQLYTDDNGVHTGSFVPRLVKIRMDADGRIDAIDTAQKGIAEGEDSLNKVINRETLYWSIRTSRFGTGEYFGVKNSDKTMIIAVPTTDIYNVEKYLFDMIEKENNSTHTIDAYDISFDGTARVIVEYYNADLNTASYLDHMGSGFVVDKVKKVLDSDNEICTAISGYRLWDGTQDQLILTDEASKTVVDRGDIVVYRKNYNDKVDFVHVMFDASTDAQFNKSYKIANSTGDYNPSFSGNAQSYYGATVITDTDSSAVKVLAPEVAIPGVSVKNLTLNEEQIYSLSNVNIFRYEDKISGVEKISPEELNRYVYRNNNSARIVFLSTYTQLKGIMIYGEDVIN